MLVLLPPVLLVQPPLEVVETGGGSHGADAGRWQGVRDGHGSVLNIKLQVSDAGSGVLISQPLHLPLEIERSLRGDFLWK